MRFDHAAPAPAMGSNAWPGQSDITMASLRERFENIGQLHAPARLSAGRDFLEAAPWPKRRRLSGPACPSKKTAATGNPGCAGSPRKTTKACRRCCRLRHVLSDPPLHFSYRISAIDRGNSGA